MKKLTESDLRNSFDSLLDEIYPLISLAGMTYNPSSVLRAVDPIAYNCLLSEWIDAGISDGCLKEIDGDIYEAGE
jgi:hypothetical protein